MLGAWACLNAPKTEQAIVFTLIKKFLHKNQKCYEVFLSFLMAVLFLVLVKLLFFLSRLQFPIECSLPWMLVDHVLESQKTGLIESALMPFDIYNDAAQKALVVLKQRFLYDEIEAEVQSLC